MNITILPQNAFLFMLLFSRLGALVMLLPAFGDVSVPGRVRLGLALAISAVLFPLAGTFYGEIPQKLFDVFPLMGSEIFIGLLIGGTARLLMSALQVAGTVISFQMGLSYAMSFDPTQGVQGALLGSFLSVLAVTLVFVTNLHHVFLAAISDSFILFKPGAIPSVASFTEMAVNVVAGAFKVGIQLSAPFMVFGLIFNLGLGILSRLMPQVQIFFVAMPANILVGLALLALLLSAISVWFLKFMADSMQPFLANG